MFEALPRAGFCLDIAHAAAIDPSMRLAHELLDAFGPRLHQVHLSALDVNGASPADRGGRAGVRAGAQRLTRRAVDSGSARAVALAAADVLAHSGIRKRAVSGRGIELVQEGRVALGGRPGSFPAGSVAQGGAGGHFRPIDRRVVGDEVERSRIRGTFARPGSGELAQAKVPAVQPKNAGKRTGWARRYLPPPSSPQLVSPRPTPLRGGARDLQDFEAAPANTKCLSTTACSRHATSPPDSRPMSYETILYAVEDSIATITLNRPDRLNTIVPPMPDEVEAAIAEATRDHDVRVIVLRGAGRAFCAGYDFGDGFEHWGEQMNTDGRWDPGKDFAMVVAAGDGADAEVPVGVAHAQAGRRPGARLVRRWRQRPRADR